MPLPQPEGPSVSIWMAWSICCSGISACGPRLQDANRQRTWKYIQKTIECQQCRLLRLFAHAQDRSPLRQAYLRL